MSHSPFLSSVPLNPTTHAAPLREHASITMAVRTENVKDIEDIQDTRLHRARALSPASRFLGENALKSSSRAPAEAPKIC